MIIKYNEPYAPQAFQNAYARKTPTQATNYNQQANVTIFIFLIHYFIEPYGVIRNQTMLNREVNVVSQMHPGQTVKRCCGNNQKGQRCGWKYDPRDPAPNLQIVWPLIHGKYCIKHDFQNAVPHPPMAKSKMRPCRRWLLHGC